MRVRTMMLVMSTLAGVLSATGARAAVTIENGTISSFDGTQIAFSFAHPDGVTVSPVVFFGHGWGLSRETAFTGGIAKELLDNGYAVLSWDARGFGASGGEANIDSQDYEVKDVQALISEVATRPTVLLDAEDDPRMGMVGGSYAGGIQLMTASADPRVDAIVPEIAWNDLPQALKPNGVLKIGWDLALYGLGVSTGTALGVPVRETGSVSPRIHIATAEGLALNDWTTETFDWFDAKSPKHYINGDTAGGRIVPGIGAPTLILQGLSDTLFNLNHGVANLAAVTANGVPAKLVAFCGGHTIAPLGTSCSTAGTAAKLTSATLAWLGRYVKGDTATDTGPAIEYQLQDGTFGATPAFPPRNVVVRSSVQLTNTVAPTTGQAFAGTSGGCRPTEGAERGGTTLPEVGPVAPSKEYIAENPYCAGGWVEITQYGDFIDLPTCKVPGEAVPPKPPQPLCDRENFRLPGGSRILGAVRLDIEATGVGTEAYQFFKLVDFDPVAKVKTVIDDQVTALKLVGLGLTQPVFATVDLAAVAWEVRPGHRIYLEITPTSNDHASSRVPFTSTLSITASVPVTPVTTFTALPNPLAFGDRGITKSATQAVKVTSTGTGDLVVTSASLSGPDAGAFALSGCSGGTFGPNGQCDVTVTFTPPIVGSYAAMLSVDTNAGIIEVPISGAGILAPFPEVTPTSIAFDDQEVGGTSAPQAVTMTNTGTAVLTITTVSAGGTNGNNFTRTTTCTNTALEPGASCSIDVAFKPTAMGPRSGKITFTTNAGPKVVTLSGTGV